jgi:hypothetical protein
VRFGFGLASEVIPISPRETGEYLQQGARERRISAQLMVNVDYFHLDILLSSMDIERDNCPYEVDGAKEETILEPVSSRGGLPLIG